MTSDADLELEFYEKFFFGPGLEPYPVQEQTVSRIFAGEHVLVTVPTGTGKTLMAKAALMRALGSGKTAIYTTPLRALTEEKFRELCDDFGEENVGFATGDYKVNPDAPIQILVAEILWNRIFSDQQTRPADVVVMDEGHYFNDFERGYVWEQSIIGLHPETQLVILSATIGAPEAFCQWVYTTRGQKMELVRSTERKVPLYHEYREDYLIETVKQLYADGDYPALIFSFGRNLCFERARLLRSCPRFVSKEEQAEINERAARVLLPTGLGPELQKILQHGIGVHHAGVLPAYRRLVEELTADRLLKFVVTTETIAAGINLPAKRVVFPSIRKYIRKKARLLLPAEYHQMAGRAGRPQFDTEGIAITLAPEEVVQDFRKEIRDLKKKGITPDEAMIKKKYYSRAKTDARSKDDVTWDQEGFQKIVDGEPAALRSRTKISAEQILAIGLPDLEQVRLPGERLIAKEAYENAVREYEAAKRARAKAEEEGAEELPEVPPEPTPPEEEAPIERGDVRKSLDINAVIDHLLLPDHKKWDAHKRLAQITKNLQALEVLDSKGEQIAGEIIGEIRGVDGVFVWWVLGEIELTYELAREMLELLIDHDAIQRIFDKKEREARRQEILARLREQRRDNPQLTFEDVEEEYEREHPRELSQMEHLHQAFVAKLAHPELHGGVVQKKIWAEIEDHDMTFLDYVNEHELGREEGSLFTYLARVMKTARMLSEVTKMTEFDEIESRIRTKLAAIDERVMEGLW
ncbi:MAG: DEAD/DEAH box helicase [Deltaproteobacteria bacterium]